MALKMTGKVMEIGETNVFPRKDGTGTVSVTKIKIGDKYFTCFYSKEDISLLKVGQEIDVTYTEKENEFEGKKYVNYNISSIDPHLDKPAPAGSYTASGARGENIINVGGKTYKVTIEEIP